MTMKTVSSKKYKLSRYPKAGIEKSIKKVLGIVADIYNIKDVTDIKKEVCNIILRLYRDHKYKIGDKTPLVVAATYIILRGRVPITIREMVSNIPGTNISEVYKCIKDIYNKLGIKPHTINEDSLLEYYSKIIELSDTEIKNAKKILDKNKSSGLTPQVKILTAIYLVLKDRKKNLPLLADIGKVSEKAILAASKVIRR